MDGNANKHNYQRPNLISSIHMSEIKNIMVFDMSDK